MSAKKQLTASDVTIIARTAKSSKARTRREGWYLQQLATERIKQLGDGSLQLASDVRLPQDAVVKLLWRIRKVALAQWQAASDAEKANVEFLDDFQARADVDGNVTFEPKPVKAETPAEAATAAAGA
jgi:hypothetical protein